MKKQWELCEKLSETHDLNEEELLSLLTGRTPETDEYLRERACEECLAHYGDQVFLRGLIEFTNFCKNDCLYCGIRKGNSSIKRYRLTEGEILSCGEYGYELGFRTFVLQGGEDPYFSDDRLCRIVSSLKSRFPECAVTLSVGERTKESYQKLFQAGADRYLLRHETADCAHYRRLHPPEMSFENRMECLRNLREIGFQTGCGFMVGSPFQTPEALVKDLRFLKAFQPHMVGIGPFLPHKDTPFRDFPKGSGELTVFLLSVIRLLLPRVLLPATTALATLLPEGRELGILHGANVVMPNLSPDDAKENYTLYDHKLSSGQEAAQGLIELKESLQKIGRTATGMRGDSLMDL